MSGGVAVIAESGVDVCSASAVLGMPPINTAASMAVRRLNAIVSGRRTYSSSLTTLRRTTSAAASVAVVLNLAYSPPVSLPMVPSVYTLRVPVPVEYVVFA
jgi:hypothetical protein